MSLFTTFMMRWRMLVSLLIALSCCSAPLLADSQSNKIHTVAFAQDTMANDWRAAQVRMLQEAFARHDHIRFIYTDAGGSTAKQIQDIEDLIHSKVDVLLTSPRDTVAMTPVIRKAYQQGIPVILITRLIQTDDYTSFVSPDDELIATSAAKYMAQVLKGKGNILMLRGIPTATTAIARERGFVREIAKHPGLHIVRSLDGNYQRADAIKAVQKVLMENTPFDAIYAHSDSMASGARLALKKAGLDPRQIPIIGIDYIHEARDAIRNREQVASYVYPTSANEAAEIALKILHGKKVPKKVIVPTQRVTRENVDRIEPIF